MEFVRQLQYLIPMIAPLLVFSACVYYLTRVKTTDSILMTVGSGIGVIMTAFFVYMPYYLQSRAESMMSMSSYYAIGGFVSLVGTVLFTVGLFMLVDKVIKLTAQKDTDTRFY